jgi:1,4-dihydroxy-2-naphthoyl-CoA hydrolase
VSDAVDRANALMTPLAKLMGMSVTAIERDRVVVEMRVREDLCTLPTGLHGGAFMALADNTGAIATVANLPEGANGATTIESKTNFLGPAQVGTLLTATATPLHRGRRTQVWQTRIEAGGRLLAVTTQTQLVL